MESFTDTGFPLFPHASLIFSLHDAALAWKIFFWIGAERAPIIETGVDGHVGPPKDGGLARAGPQPLGQGCEGGGDLSLCRSYVELRPVQVDRLGRGWASRAGAKFGL